MASGEPPSVDRSPARWVDVLLILWLGFIWLSPTPQAERQGYLYGDSLHYGAIAKSTLASGDWLALKLGDQPYFNKPPLLFWMAMASFSAFGISTWTAQLVGIVFGLALLVGVYALGSHLIDRRHGLLAAVVLCFTYVFLKNASVLRMDAPLACFGLLALGSVLLGERRRGWLALFWASCALGVVLKGAAGLLPVPVLVLWCLLRKRVYPWNVPIFWSTLPLVPLLVLPWVLHNLDLYGDLFVDSFAADMKRITQTVDKGPAIVKYVRDLFWEGWPWVPFILHGLILGVRAIVRGEREDRWSLPMAWIVGVMAMILPLAGAYSRYVIPLLPASSLLVACSILTIFPRLVGRWFYRVLFGFAIVGSGILHLTDIDVHGNRKPDVMRFREQMEAHGQQGVTYQLNTLVSWHLQAAAIFYMDWTVEPMPPDELLERVPEGEVLAVFVRRREDGQELPPLPDGIEAETLQVGVRWDLVALRRTSDAGG